MDLFPALRDQTQKKILCDLKRMNNKQNKTRADAKLFKDFPSAHLSSKDGENKDPAGVGKPCLQPGVSKIPVLSKSLRLQTSSEFKHVQWEEKTLACKSKRKKQCTRPVPFNFSLPKHTTKTNTRAVKPETSVCGEKPGKHQVVLNNKAESMKSVWTSHGKTSENATQLSGQFNPLKTSNNPLCSKPSNAVHQDEGSPARSAAGAEVSLVNMKLLSLKETTTSSNSSQTTLGNPSKALGDKGKNFQSDHSALLSILRNEGVCVTSQAQRTPKSQSCNNQPMRVSVRKSRQKAGPTTGLGRVCFSPDPAALQSILQNEGVKAGGAFGATPRTSVCPPHRNTSVYTAQRAPLKNNTEVAVSFGPVALKTTPLQNWTIQRVRKANHQPVSSMKLTQTPYSTSGPRSIKNNLQPCQKGVVQRLFEDPDEEQDTSGLNKEPRTQTEQLQVKACSNNNPCDEKLEACDNEEEEDRTSLALPRESVIFFSTGKKFFRAPRPENREVSAQQDQPGPVSPDQTNLPAAPKETSAESEPGLSTNSSVLHLHREFIPEKAFHLHPAVAMLRKRLPLLEELRLDEEVSTYTAVSVPAAFLPPLPRCGNPLASILHFEESTRFVPISFDLSSGPSQLQSSRLHER